MRLHFNSSLCVTCVGIYCIFFAVQVLSVENVENKHFSCLTQSDGMAESLYGTLVNAVDKAKCDLSCSNKWPEDAADWFLKENSPSFDYVIVGGGTAGSVVASRLSEDPNVRVLVLEAGADPPLESEIHTITLSLQKSSYSWQDYSVNNGYNCQGMKNNACYWPRGKMLGGTGALNGNVYLSGYPKDYNHWAAMGNTGWSWPDVAPYYYKITEHTKDTHKGSLVLNYFQRTENYAKFLKLMLKANVEVYKNDTRYVAQYLGERALGTIDRGIRMSTGKTYLGRVAKYRPNLKVIKQAEVTRLHFDSQNVPKKIKSVEFLLHDYKTLRVNVERELILSAGTFGSPKLLMLSGLGPREHLQKHNITVLHDLRVGSNLQDHGMLPLSLVFRNRVPFDIDEENLNSVKNIFDYFLNQKGPLASNPTLLGFLKTPGDIMMVSSMAKSTWETNTYEFLQFQDHITEDFLLKTENLTVINMVGLLKNPTSSGFVRLKSSNLKDGLIIENNYVTSEEEFANVLSYIRYVQKLTESPTFRYYGLELVRLAIPECDKLPYDSAQYWKCYVKYFYISAWHATGTCRMGPSNDPLSVVDPHLRVIGVEGVRVVDASIMPKITTANTATATIVIAEKAADMIKADAIQYYNSV